MTENLIDRLVAHEGSKRFAYQDSLGYWTIGIGRCIDKRSHRGLTLEEQYYLLRNDIEMCRNQLCFMPVYKNLDDVRREVLIELCFNMGIERLLGFRKMFAALEVHDYIKAVAELKDSLWSKQVQPKRVEDISYRLLNGKYRDTKA